jgi:glucuronoarabinoxylan endo-1,4-beta-xylanase
MSCVAGVCSPTLEPTASVSVDDTQRFQSLVGIGAGIGYVLDEIVQHPRKAALFDSAFSDSGLTLLRLRNRYGQEGEEDLGSTSEIITAAAERLGQTPTIILNSASPPGSLKANGSNYCDGNPDTCTLITLADGTFDYAGLANHWRASLDAYALAGIEPDYISIQNNPDWVPDAGNGNEACRFLPTEGTATVTTDSGDIEVRYPGYAEALDAVLSQLAGLATVPGIAAPETTGFSEVADYLAALDMANVDAIAHHLYQTDLGNLDLAALAELGDLGEQDQRPLFQSEMYADPLTTAVLLHAALAVEGAAMYVHNGFVATAALAEPDQASLVSLTDDDFVIGDVYHILRHYSGHIAPGWVRVAADSDVEDLLASAWISPEEDALVVVLTNAAQTERAVQLDLNRDDTATTEVTRTVLGGIERSAELGALPAEGIVTVPGESIVTVVAQQ